MRNMENFQAGTKSVEDVNNLLKDLKAAFGRKNSFYLAQKKGTLQ